MIPSGDTRDPSIDALRVGALLAGIALHAAVPYLSAPVPELLWPVQAPSGSWAADLVFWWGRCAQSQLFFLLAGLTSASVLDGRGPVAFARARLRQIGVPLLSGVVFVLPVVGAVWAWGWLESGRVSWTEVRSWRFTDPEIARNALGPAHLWFLEDLLVISLLFAGWRWVTALRETQRTRPTATTLAGVVTLGWTILWLRPDVLFDGRQTFVPNVFRLASDATFFLCGVWLARDRQAPTRWPRAWVMLGGAAAAAFLVTRLISDGTLVTGRGLLLASAATATSWLSVLGSLRLVTSSTFMLPAVLRRLAARSYPIYVLHLPIVGVAHVLLRPSTIDATLAILIVTTSTLAVTWLLIEGATRLSPAARTLVERSATVRIGVWTTSAVAAGIALRLIQYARNPDVWLDEAALLVNVIEHDYVRLLGPLTYNGAGPPLFLWAERWIAVTMGDSPRLMRMLPLAASCAGLVAFLPMTRVITRRMAPVAVLLMALSINMIDHSAEAKSYTIDVLVAAGAGAAFVLTSAWSIARRAMLFAVVTPLLVWVSYPAVFVLGGVLAALTIAARQQRRMPHVVLVALAVVIGLSITVLWAGPVRAQRTTEILEYWRWAFPAGFDPLSLLGWVARSAVGIADYCFRPFGGILLIPIAAGTTALVRRRDHPMVALLLTPLVLAALAGVAGQYAFSGTRVMLFVLPALAVLAAEGLGAIVSNLPASAALLRASVVAIAVLPPIVLCGRELISPAQRIDTAAAAKFVLETRRPEEIVASDQWEYRYYLRELGTAFVAVPERPLPLGQQRLWLLVHGARPDERRASVVAGLGDFYRIDRTVDLRGVSVMSLSANQPRGSAP